MTDPFPTPTPPATPFATPTGGVAAPSGEAVAPSGEQWLIAHGSQQVVVTEVGATLRSYSVAGEPLVDGFEVGERCTDGRGQVLAPWPNRLGDGRYSFGGVEAQAALDEPFRHNAIHGLVRWLPWRLVGRAQNRVSLACLLHPTPSYPFTLELTVEYRLGRDGLTVATEAQNRGAEALPFGLGFHPYLTVGSPVIDTAHLTLPARRRLLLDDRGLPVGEEQVAGTPYDFSAPRPIGPIALDAAYTGLDRDAAGRTEVVLEHPGSGRSVRLWADEQFPYLMAYTGDGVGDISRRRRSIAVEPMTCPPDAFRSGEGIVTLSRGERWSARWGLVPAGRDMQRNLI